MCRIMSTLKHGLTVLKCGPTPRNLFGAVDHEQLLRDYRDHLQSELEDASRRWDFDFLTETPRQGGDFQWEAVSETKVPALYHSCTVREGCRLSEITDGVVVGSHSGIENIPCTPKREFYQGLEESTEKRQSHRVKRKQTNITDFYQAKRRAVNTPRKSGQ